LGNIHILFKCPVCNEDLDVVSYDAPIVPKESIFQCPTCLSTFALDEMDESPSSRKLVLVDIDRKLAEKLLSQDKKV
jgi:transcription initiation factor IIE alpha subunit